MITVPLKHSTKEFVIRFLPLQLVTFVLASAQSLVYSPSPDSVPAAILA